MSKVEMARRMQTSRSSLDRLLDPANVSLNLATVERAASALGRKVVIRLDPAVRSEPPLRALRKIFHRR